MKRTAVPVPGFGDLIGEDDCESKVSARWLMAQVGLHVAVPTSAKHATCCLLTYNLWIYESVGLCPQYELDLLEPLKS